MTHSDTDVRADLRDLVARICADFGDDYWKRIDDERSYPEAFVDALTGTGLLGALVPEEFGGLGLGLGDASVILEEINYRGGNAAPVHAQLYTMGALLRHGSAEQKKKYLPGIASGSVRLQSFAVTEPGAGTDTTSITTRAVRQGDRYVVNG